MKGIQRFIEWFKELSILGLCLAVFGMFLKAFEPAWPVVTIFVVLSLTLHALNRGKFFAFGALLGIALYIAAWPVAGKLGDDVLGLWLSLMLTSSGVLTWTGSVCFSFAPAYGRTC